ncbi:uroporphyrinogen decarboxylase family protein [Falseniella ignava]|uniref:MtaA/CmuA family methyltransferase n=1 Tax=Falseniella ignava CCUG 37419 TaxID=883112 RepID=K1M0E5_9LACT|nr:uroporphyrinogen decarboxylase family protein [Falseniella ignava]EKB55773.1 MtaA/CmuA family methyltransferase [Falseniella ignava CCUG 37419]
MKLKKNFHDEMTPVERRRAIQQGKEIDRIPVDLLIVDNKAQLVNCNVRDLFFDRKIMVEAELKTYERFGVDWLSCSPNSKAISQSLGGNFIFPENKSAYCGDPILKDYSYLEMLEPKEVSQDDRLKLYYEVAEDLAEIIYNEVNMHIYIGGPLTIASYLRGVENVMKDMRKHPENLHKLLKIVTESMKKVINAFSEIDGIVFALADPVSSCDITSPKNFNEFSYPYLKEVCDYAFEKTGEKPYIHICGKTEKIWDQIIKLKLSTFSIDNECNLREAVLYFGDKIGITGNIPPYSVMARGTHEDIKRSYESCLENGYRLNKNYILGLGCDYPLGSDLTNIDYLMHLVRSYH